MGPTHDSLGWTRSCRQAAATPRRGALPLPQTRNTNPKRNKSQSLQSVRDISAAVAAAVIAAAHAEGHVASANAATAAAAGPAALLRYVKRMMYSPAEYSSLAYRPVGL